VTEPTSTEPENQSWVKDPELEDLFAAWDADQRPSPHDPLLPAVTARIAHRRRNRRAATAVVVAAAVLIAGVVAHFYVADHHSDHVSATDNPGLTIRYSGKAYTFTSFTDVVCTTDAANHEVLEALFRPEDAISGSTLRSPILSFEARLDLVADKGPSFNLPEAPGQTENNAFTLFTAVPVASGDDNEASSQEGAAIGTVTITNLTCGHDPTFTLKADATLGSEVSGPTIPISGQITYPPPS
jgi:hypothetical protein